MENTVLDRYEDVLFQDKQLDLFVEILNISRKNDNDIITAAKVLRVIINHSRPPEGKGITKKDIQDTLKISRKVCDDFVSILQGATFIKYIHLEKEMPYFITRRGLQVFKAHNDKKGA